MPLPEWEPTETLLPSETNRGEKNAAAIHTAVGFALSQWEHLESVLARLFQLLSESPSFAACRGYGMVESSRTRAEMLRAAREVFFQRHGSSDTENITAVESLIAAYENALQYRNNIAHGMATAFPLKGGQLSGYFLCSPSYASRKMKAQDLKGLYLLGAKYWYKGADIRHYADWFTQLEGEAMRLIQVINAKYSVLDPAQFLP